MNLLQNKKFQLFLLVFLMLLSSAFPSAAGVATFYKGNTALGQIPVMDSENGYVISIADAGALLGLEASVAGEELLLTRGTVRLKIVLNAVAAWYNNQLVPLYGASTVQEGRWWLDVPSALSLLQRVVGRGGDRQLRVEEIRPGTVAENSPAPSATDVKEKETTETSTGVKVVTASGPEKNVKIPPAVQSTLPQGGDEVRAVRWSTSREKVRAVIDCSEGTNPELKVSAGRVSMTFARAAENLTGIPSPYENVKTELVTGTGTTALVFTAASVRVEKLVLDNPRRIVLDFIFAAQETIKETPQPSQAPVAEVSRVEREGPKKKGKLLVVLDPGHGGKDPGAIGNGFQEKDINLSIGLKMEKALKAKGLDVRMTRNTDVYLKLQERTDIANKLDADMFVSIHVNSLPPGKNSTGFEIYLMALPTDKDALALAKIENREYLEDKGTNGAASDRRTELLLKILGDMQQNNKINESTVAAEVLFKAGNTSELPMKRVAQAPFFVLRGAGMPAVLLETGFITNAREAKLLAHQGYQQKIADAMTEGIYNYLR